MKRILAIDLLRGLDLFFLLALGPLVIAVGHALGDNATWFAPVVEQFTHKNWSGLSMWDMVMPLFMFTAGLSMPFALKKKDQPKDNYTIYGRIAKRFVVLWLLGMLCQGNILALDPDHIYLYSNTLQAIAVGYLFGAIVYLNFGLRWQIVIAGMLLVIYALIMGGDYQMGRNVADVVDQAVLGRFRDGASVDALGVVQFAPWYGYTWIVSSLNFIVTVITGVFAGTVIKSASAHKTRTLLLMSASMLVAGYVWSIWMPIGKPIWTSSMTLVTSGYSTLLIALLYWTIDVKGWSHGWGWLAVYGTNSITAYVLFTVVNFSCIGTSILFGLQQYIGPWYAVLITVANAALLYGLLYFLHKNKIFIKV